MENEALREPSRVIKASICEVCRAKPAVSFSFFFRDLNQGYGGDWKYCCGCTTETEDYYIPFNDFFPEEPHWLAHLEEKGWMDWNDWNAMMVRFRDEV